MQLMNLQCFELTFKYQLCVIILSHRSVISENLCIRLIYLHDTVHADMMPLCIYV